LCDNRDIKVLDLSWNQLGVKPFKRKKVGRIKAGMKEYINFKKGDIGKAWGTMFIENKGIVHLDLSFNRFGYEDTKQMELDLKMNHTIIGLHFKGNKANEDPIISRIDSLGFIR